jgi:hypothetical protein
MDLRHLTDETLLKETKDLKAKELAVLTALLHHLREIERRRLFSGLKYKSLYDYAIRDLGYPEDQAARRISAMRLMKEIPSIAGKIANGSLSLTNLCLAQTFFRREKKVSQKKYSSAEKLEVLQKLENKSTRAAKKIVLQISPEAFPKEDQIKPVSEDLSEIRFVVDEALLEKIQKLKGLLAHSHPNIGMADLVNMLCDLGIQKLDPAQKKSSAAPRVPESKAATKREIWKRDFSQCRNCGSNYAVQTDHSFPRGLGGDSTTQNLRLLCRSCNQRAAIEAYGIGKMEPYIDSQISPQ